MTLTPREREIVSLLRAEPLLDASGLASRLDTTRASISMHLTNLSRKGVILGRGYLLRGDDAVVVIGGANLDIKARAAATHRLATSNPGAVTITPGGVARNIAENLARLGSHVRLVAAVGSDAFGGQLRDATRAAGVNVDHLVTTAERTGTYLALLDELGELVSGVSDMSATDELTPAVIDAARPLLAGSAQIVLDGNLQPETLAAALAAAGQTPVVIDPVSVAKAGRLAPVLNPDRPVFAITPNLDELGALVGDAGVSEPTWIAMAADLLHQRGVEHVWVRRGRLGSQLFSRGEEPVSIPSLATVVADVTGAGDSMTAGFVHALIRGDGPADAARFAAATAALTVAVPQTVRPDLTEALVEAALAATPQGVS